MNVDYFWLAVDCLEKYFKAVLLLNVRSSLDFGHEIEKLYEAVTWQPPADLFRLVWGLRPPCRQGQALRVLRAENDGRVVAPLQPAPNPSFPGLDANPPLIGASLVRLHAQPLLRLGERSVKADVYERITSRIVAELEQGLRPWLKPWNTEHAAGRITRPLRMNGQPYQGINVLMLWGEAVTKGFSAPIWMTFKQAAEIGAHVRKGEHGSLVVYADRIRRTELDEATGEEAEREIPFLKGYTVFNVEQIEGLPAHFYAPAAQLLNPVQRIERADTFFAETGATIRHGGSMAYYSSSDDRVQMPPFESFPDAETYYATLAHEMTHWTKPGKRLDRDFGRKRWGDEGYAMEELVAELGAAFLSADLDLTPEPREDHASYIASWLQMLKNDKRAIFTAASHAQRAADYLNGLQSATRMMKTSE
ncbi:antirestriction protein ArdC [Bradyrhizobium sp. USDA 377]